MFGLKEEVIELTWLVNSSNRLKVKEISHHEN